jgi:hypothetical protein
MSPYHYRWCKTREFDYPPSRQTLVKEEKKKYNEQFELITTNLIIQKKGAVRIKC